MLCVEIGCNLLTQWFSKLLSLFCYVLPLEKGLTLHLNKLYISLKSKYSACFLSNLVEIGSMVPGVWSLKFVNAFSLFCYYLLLGKSMVFHLIKFKFCPTQKSVLCEVWPWFRRQIWISEKFTTTTKSTTKGQMLITKAHTCMSLLS